MIKYTEDTANTDIKWYTVQNTSNLHQFSAELMTLRIPLKLIRERNKMKRWWGPTQKLGTFVDPIPIEAKA